MTLACWFPSVTCQTHLIWSLGIFGTVDYSYLVDPHTPSNIHLIWRHSTLLFSLLHHRLLLLRFPSASSFSPLYWIRPHNIFSSLVCVCAKSLQWCLFVTLWTVAHKAPLSMEFSRQEYWSRLPFPSPGDLPSPGIEPVSPALQADSSLLSHWGSPFFSLDDINSVPRLFNPRLYSEAS